MSRFHYVFIFSPSSAPILAASSPLTCWWLVLAEPLAQVTLRLVSWQLPRRWGRGALTLAHCAACLSHGRAAPPGQVILNHNSPFVPFPKFTLFALREFWGTNFYHLNAKCSCPHIQPWPRWLPWPSQASFSGGSGDLVEPRAVPLGRRSQLMANSWVEPPPVRRQAAHCHSLTNGYTLHCSKSLGGREAQQSPPRNNFPQR